MKQWLNSGNLTLLVVTGWVLGEADTEPELGIHKIKRRTQDWAGDVTVVWLWCYCACLHKEQISSHSCTWEDFHVAQKLLGVPLLSYGMGEWDRLLKVEAIFDETNSLTILLTSGSESSGCVWCIFMSTILVSNTQSILKCTSCPVTPFIAKTPFTALQISPFSSWRKMFPEAPQMTFLYHWSELKFLSMMGQEKFLRSMAGKGE